MTIEKIAYIGCKNLDNLEDDLIKAEMGDMAITKYPAEGKELWVAIDQGKNTLDVVRNGYLTAEEKTEIIKAEVNTILFYS